MANTKATHSLKSTEQREVALALTDMQLSAISDHQVSEKLKNVRDIVWSSKNPSDEEKKIVFDAALQDLNPEQRTQLFESYVRMGELYELAGITARDNYFDDLENRKKPIPGGVQEFIKNISLEDAMSELAKPVFETTMTMHPTNIQGLEPMKKLRAIANILHGKEIKDADGNAINIESAIADYQATNILHKVNGEETNLTVRDETKTVLNYLGNIYEDLPGIFEKFDKPLSRQFEESYQPLDFKLDARFGSWGSGGDKDGNDNVTAEKTLEALVRHTENIFTRYGNDLEQLHIPALEEWKTKFATASEELKRLLAQAETLSDDTDAMRKDKTGGNKDFDANFDSISNRLSEIRESIKIKSFETDLESSYKSNPEAAEKSKLLELVRKVRWFGDNFAKIEYRETAEEYEKVLDKLIPHYSDLTPEKRVETLTQLLESPDQLKALQHEASDIIKEGASKPLSDKSDATAITYHTLKRMELARDHGDMVKDNVLAECGALDKGKYPNPTPEQVSNQGVANLLEAQLLQRIVDKEGKKALLGVVPLFEDPDTMQNVDKIMGAAYDNVAYKKHLEALAQDRYAGVATQQVQIAHSDNRRRSGSLAGTALIHEAHGKLRAVNAEKGIKIQFFEGGSMSDAYRNGVRSVSAQVNAYGLQDFAKFTFQGRDLQNYTNHPGSVERFFTRQFVHQASYMYKKDKGIVNGDQERAPNAIVDDIAIAALKQTRQDYIKDDFTKESMGTLLAVLGSGYDREAKVSNRGSRAAARVFGGGTATAHVGAVIEPIAVDKLRTIPFSMMPQQNQLSPAWIGGQHLDNYIQNEIQHRVHSIESGTDKAFAVIKAGGPAADKMKKDVDFFESNFGSKSQTLEAQRTQIIYEKSPTFRDAMDKAAFAVARTDMAAVRENVDNKLQQKGITFKNADMPGNARNYTKLLSNTYASMGNVVYAALTGKPLQSAGNQPNKFTRHQKFDEQAALTQAFDQLNKLGQEISEKNNYQDFVVHAKSTLMEGAQLTDHDLAVLLAGGLTSTHSRWSVSDPAFARARGQDSQRPVSSIG